MRILSAGLFLLFLNHSIALATGCSVAGKLTYSTTTHRMQYCDPSNFSYTIDGGQLAGTCTGAEEGKQQFSAGIMQYCDGSFWRSMVACGPLITSCFGGNGKMYSTANGRVIFCASNRWYVSYGSCSLGQNSLACVEFNDSASCAANSCQWSGGQCRIPGCAGYMTALSCNQDVNCGWVSNTCVDNI